MVAVLIVVAFVFVVVVFPVVFFVVVVFVVIIVSLILKYSSRLLVRLLFDTFQPNCLHKLLQQYV